MKNSLLTLLLVTTLVVLASFTKAPEKVTLKLKNNGLLAREFKFLERHPDIKEPNVFTAYILPGQSIEVTLRVGTSLAQVTQPEILATMQGQNVPGKPLLVVTAEDNGKVIKLIQ